MKKKKPCNFIRDDSGIRYRLGGGMKPGRGFLLWPESYFFVEKDCDGKWTKVGPDYWDKDEAVKSLLRHCNAKEHIKTNWP